MSSHFEDLSSFDHWSEENADWVKWANLGASDPESGTYSPEAVFRALKKAQQIAEKLLDEQSFREMQDRGEFDEADVDGSLDTISKVNAISYEDWQQKITSKNDYQYGAPYAMLLRSIRSEEPYDPRQTQYLYQYTSCSLVTQDSVKLYHDRVGFVYPAEGVVAADTGDMATNNYAKTPDEVLSFREVPLIKPFEEVLEETGTATGYGFVGDYNEVVVEGLPSAIFYYDEEDLEKARELQKLSGLDIIRLHEVTHRPDGEYVELGK